MIVTLRLGHSFNKKFSACSLVVRYSGRKNGAFSDEIITKLRLDLSSLAYFYRTLETLIHESALSSCKDLPGFFVGNKPPTA